MDYAKTIFCYRIFTNMSVERLNLKDYIDKSCGITGDLHLFMIGGDEK